MLLRESRNLALLNIEKSARTEEDFNKVNIIYDEMELIERDRIDKHEQDWFTLPNLENEVKDESVNFEVTDRNIVIPKPFNHEYWRQMQSGNFLDLIHDCPHDIPEMTSSRPIYAITKDLNEDALELMYYKIIRRWSIEALAIRRNQSDRNIRKVYTTIIENIRWDLYIRLYSRYKNKKSLTYNQKCFMEWFWEQLSEYQQQKMMRQIEDNRRSWLLGIRKAAHGLKNLLNRNNRKIG